MTASADSIVDVSEPESSERDRYSQTWRRMNLQSRLFWAGIGVSCLLGFVLINGFFGPIAPLPCGGIVGAVALAVGTIYLLSLHAVRCPQCGKRFCGDSLMSLVFPHGRRRAGRPPERCVFCGLRFGAEPPPGPK